MAVRAPKPPRDPWERFLDRWPAIARVVGVAGGFGAFLASLVTGKGPDPAWLSWCAALTVAPNVFGRSGRGGGEPPAEGGSDEPS